MKRSGIDKVAGQVELFQLPAPIFEDPEGFTRIVLFAHRPLVEMEKADRVRACYLHACLRYVTRQHMTNSSVRQRFGIEGQNAATASRLLKEAVEAGSIAPYDPKAANKLMRYVPYWAAPTRASVLRSCVHAGMDECKKARAKEVAPVKG